MRPKSFPTTLPAALDSRLEMTPEDDAFLERTQAGEWRATKWKDFGEAVTDLALRLRSAGLEKGQQAAILMPNSIQWEIIQHAVYRLGGVVIGLDLNDPPARMTDIFSLCAPGFLFVDDPRRLKQIPTVVLSRIQVVVTQQNNVPSVKEYNCISLDRLPFEDAIRELPEITGEDMASMIFTSGTTGRPKALTFCHRQFTQAMAAISSLFKPLPRQAHTACWLPLANPFQRMVNLCALRADWKTFMVSDPTAIISLIREISPHLFTAVPRFYEKLYQGIQQQMTDMPVGLRSVAHWAVGIGAQYQTVKSSGRTVPRFLQWRHSVAEKMILKKIRSIMGVNLCYLISGSAPAGDRLLQAYTALGWSFLEAYGISENIVPMAINSPTDMCPGSVGRPLAVNEIRISPDKEIWVRGPGLAMETDADLTDGYLKTGDLGYLDEDGFLHLVGRKGDMFKLSTGRKIIPRAIEEAAMQIKGVEYCVAVGENRKFVTLLLNLSEAIWQQLLQVYGSDEKASNFLLKEAQNVCSHLPRYSRPADVAVTCARFSPESGELTTNLKLRRKFVLAKYADIINSCYRGKDIPVCPSSPNRTELGISLQP